MRLGFIMVRIDPNDKLMLSSFLACKQGVFFSLIADSLPWKSKI
jgi:hypothetical protein